MADSSKPYGDVKYADPGYQSDGKARYPIDTAEHCKAAWSYINQQGNASKYTSEQLAHIKGRIKSAAKKFGIQISDESKSAEPLDIDVVRAVDLAQEFRAAVSADDGIGLLTGHFSVFDTWYRVDSKWEGTFLENADRASYTQTIAEDRDRMKVLFDHGFDPSIGNKVIGPIRELRPDQRGGYYAVPMFDTSYNRDLLPGLKAGVYGASMRMHVEEDRWDKKPERSAHNPEGIPERIILRARVMEFGPVTFPASPSATAGVRSMTDYYYDQLRQRDSGAYEAAVRAAGRRTPDFVGRPGARSSGGDESDAKPGNGGASPRHLRQRLDHDALRTRGILR